MAEQNGAAGLPSADGAMGDATARASRGILHKLPMLDISAAQGAADVAVAVAMSAQEPDAPPSPSSPSDQRRQSARGKPDKQKLGHRRMCEGEVTYKKIQTTTIMGAIQLGISYAVGSEASKPRRDVLLSDFYTMETIAFPCQGSQHTPAHHFAEFRFKIYATIGFKYFRNLFGIQPDDFLLSMCNEPLSELTNAGASGSIFYRTQDDEFIVKTVQHKEGELLLKLLPAYFLNLNQNPRTLLPKFFGLYCYQCNSKNIRLVVMNNLLPSSIKMHQRYDLKGSTYKRKANKQERAKKSPTYKDLDFMDHHPEGLMLEASTYNALMQTIQKDVRVLESFEIMDYSLLVGVHNLDLAAKEKAEAADDDQEGGAEEAGLQRSRSINRHRLVAHSTAMESIQAESEPIDDEQDVPPGGIPARNSRGERLLLFLGIIDILQSYRIKKRLEHTLKSMVHDGSTISVHRPDFYQKRFVDFMAKTVFQKIPSPLRHSPSKRKGQSLRMRVLDSERREAELAAESRTRQLSRPVNRSPVPVPPPAVDAAAAVEGAESQPAPSQVSLPSVLLDRPVVVSRQRVPPPVPPRSPKSLAQLGRRGLQQQVSVASSASTVEPEPTPGAGADAGSSSRHITQVTIGGTGAGDVTDDEKRDCISVSDVRLETCHDSRSTLSVDSGPAAGGAALRHVTWTPPMSVEGSTPTWTEGTPSFTESSSSGDVGCPTTPIKSLTASRDSGVNTMPYTKLASPERTPAAAYTETEMGSAPPAAASAAPVDAVCIHVAGPSG